ncbi:MAG: transporter [Nocardia sp.]|uniref:MFS transporter n=1 Tax=Nocardia sp. TaxID=1821 RepID=UPI002635F7B9|nr:MFS transporter [Nocardia sp.]MCU1640252.1 transporter [Nocardia sp.]
MATPTAQSTSVNSSHSRNDAVSQTPMDAVSQTPMDAVSQTRMDAVSQTRMDAVSQTRMDAVSQTRMDAVSQTRNRTVWLAAWPVFAVFALSNAATPLYGIWQRELGFSSGTLTAIFACYIVGLLSALLVAGVVSDRVGRKPVLLPAIGLAMLASMLFATAGSVVMLAIARLLTGIAVGAIVSAGMAAVTDIGGPERKRVAALAASTAMVLGAGFGPLLAGVLSETLPGPTTTIFVIEIALLASAFVLVARWDLPKGAGGRGPWVRFPAVAPGGRTAVAVGIAVFAPGITATSFVLSLGPSVLSHLLGATNRVVAGGLAFVMFLAATAIQFAVRPLRVRSVLLGGAAATATSMIALVASLQCSSLPLFVAAAVFAGIGQGLGQLGGLTAISAAVPADRLAETNAAQNVGGYLPAAVLPVTAGFLSDAIGLTAGATAFGAVVLSAAAAGGLYAALRSTGSRAG